MTAAPRTMRCDKALAVKRKDCSLILVSTETVNFGVVDNHFGKIKSNALSAAAIRHVRNSYRIDHLNSLSVVCGSSTVTEAGGAASAPGGGLWK